jgi:hypothetical protein
MHAFLLEFGISVPRGAAVISRLSTILEDNSLPLYLSQLLLKLQQHYHYLVEQIKDLESQFTLPEVGKGLTRPARHHRGETAHRKAALELTCFTIVACLSSSSQKTAAARLPSVCLGLSACKPIPHAGSAGNPDCAYQCPESGV